MDCAQFDEILHDLDRPGTQGAAMRDSALAHAESCNRCADLLNRTEWLDFHLLRLKLDIALKEAPGRLESSILQEFRRTTQRSARRRVLRQVAMLGTAAALLLALGFSLRRHNQSFPVASTTGTSPAAVSAAHIAAPPSSPPGIAQAPLAAPVRPEISGANRSTASQDAQPDGPAQYATNFMPLPYADDSLADEGGAIVRVQISRAALASLGLPVVEGDGAQRLQADLVLSADGTPQAIRLVSDEEPAEE